MPEPRDPAPAPAPEHTPAGGPAPTPSDGPAPGETIESLRVQLQAQREQARRYREIFEANKPMLTDPDKIYPGQVLRIPAAD